MSNMLMANYYLEMAKENTRNVQECRELMKDYSNKISKLESRLEKLL
jgi:hypothetical protein